MTLAAMLDRAPGRYSVFAKNLRTGKTVAYRETDVLPSASLIKVPIMIEIFRRVEEEHLSLDRRLLMRAEDQVGGSGVLSDLTAGTRYRLRDLTTLMITVSDNTATNLLIDYLGTDSVNATLAHLGCHSTRLIRRLERVPSERNGVNQTTSYDMSRLMELIAGGQAVSEAASLRMLRLLERCQGPLAIAPPLPPPPALPGEPPARRVAHKTGGLSDARHDSGIVYAGRLVYVATLMSHGAPERQLAETLARLSRLLPRLLR